MWRPYGLTVGLPQTNHRQLSEPRLLMEAANVFWWALGEAVSRPVSKWRSAADEPVYATIYFIEERFPQGRGLRAFGLDDRLQLFVGIRAFSTLAVDARVVFDRTPLQPPADDDAWWCAAPPHPMIRFGSLFATPVLPESRFKPAAPANARLDALPSRDADAELSRLMRQSTGGLGVIPADWPALHPAPVSSLYPLDPDRDSNAAGLVYFATYAAALESGERQALAAAGCSEREIAAREPAWRRVAYYGNTGLSDQLMVEVTGFRSAEPGEIGLRAQISRRADGKLICRSETRLRS